MIVGSVCEAFCENLYNLCNLWLKSCELVFIRGLKRIDHCFGTTGFAGADARVHGGELLQIELQRDHFMDRLAVADVINHLAGEIQIRHGRRRDDFLRRRRLDIWLERLVDLHDACETVADNRAL